MKFATIIKYRSVLLWFVKLKLKGLLMGKKEKKEKKGPNRNKIKAGDVYVVDNDFEVVDIDGDGVADLVATHTVTNNGQLLVKSETTWYGLEDSVVDAFVAAAEEAGLFEDYETDKFNQVNKGWKKITRFLQKIQKLADVKAAELGEEVEE